MRGTPRHQEKKKGRDRQRQARNRSSHACLPKRTTLSAREGEGSACMDRKQAEWVLVLELQLKASLPSPAVILLSETHEGFTAIFKEEIAKYTAYYESHLFIFLMLNKMYF